MLCILKMKIKNIFVVLITFCILNTSLCTKFIRKFSIDDEILSKSICKITNHITNSKSDTQDILIGNLGGQNGSSMVSDIIHCIDGGKAVVATDLRNTMKNVKLRKASVIILKLNRVDAVSIYLKFQLNRKMWLWAMRPIKISTKPIKYLHLFSDMDPKHDSKSTFLNSLAPHG